MFPDLFRVISWLPRERKCGETGRIPGCVWARSQVPEEDSLAFAVCFQSFIFLVQLMCHSGFFEISSDIGEIFICSHGSSLRWKTSWIISMNIAKVPPFPKSWSSFQYDSMFLNVCFPPSSLQSSYLNPNSEFFEKPVCQFPQITYVVFRKNQLLPPLAVKIKQGPAHASAATRRGVVGDGSAWGAPARAFVPPAQPAWLISSREKILRPRGSFKSLIPYKIQLLFGVSGDVKYSCSDIKGMKASPNWNWMQPPKMHLD